MSEMNRITVGSIVEFGSWEQCSGITARTPIDWLVLETDGRADQQTGIGVQGVSR